ncbi:MAG: PQQ-like beta-propeller repeat protein [Planctomycetia bacterium]|nr:PQQ-like beta-propeller repeat protein [Planctomycetia bacterium]
MKTCLRLPLALLLATQLGSAPAARAANEWPAWRGPERTGVSHEQGLARQWPEGGPPLAWTATGVGVGFSTPSIAGGRIYLMGNRDGREFVFALSATDGKQLWATPLGPVRHDGAGYPGPRSTPTVDGARVYALGINGDLVCLDAATGAGVWKHDLVADLSGSIPGWGYSESVLVDGPWLLCTPGGGRATIAALDKTTGKPVWMAKVGDPAAYSSLVAAQIEGVKQYVQFTNKGVISVDSAGGLLWRYDAPANGTANCSTPVCDGNRVFAASGYGAGGGLVDVTRSGDGLKANQVYFTKHMKNHHGGMVLVDGHLYGSDDPGILTCLELATGKVKWSDRSSGKSALVCVDRMLYCRGEQGLVSLVDASPDGFRLHGRFEQPGRSDAPSWPHPVVCDGRLYLRDQDKLLAYDVRR